MAPQTSDAVEPTLVEEGTSAADDLAKTAATDDSKSPAEATTDDAPAKEEKEMSAEPAKSTKKEAAAKKAAALTSQSTKMISSGQTSVSKSSRAKSSSSVGSSSRASSTSGRVYERQVGKSIKKKAPEDGSEGAPKPVRAKSFKRIRGFLKGRSSKKIKKDAGASSRRAGLSASVASGAQGEDGSVYNVTLDERSVSTERSSIRSKGPDGKYLLRMVLLLMDVETRRFELLQLEFDSEKALVADVLTQVPASVTEEKLRSQKYSGVVAAEGDEQKSDKLLSSFCGGNDILVGVPEGVDPNEARRLAKPILSDKKVVGMLQGSGLDTTGWVKSSQPAGEAATEDKKAIEDAESSGEVLVSKPVSKPMMGGPVVFGAIVAVLGLLAATMVHKYISTPVQPGQIVSPGIVLSKCGLKFWSGCSRAYLDVQADTVSYYEGKKLSWVIHGNSCPEAQIKDKTCADGLVFKNDRSLWLGGSPIKWLEHYADEDGNKNDAELTPWPFTEEPKIKTWEIAAGRVTGTASKIAGDAKKAAGKLKDGTVTAAGKIKNGTVTAAGKVANGTVTAAGKVSNVTVAAAGKVADTTVTAAGKVANTTVAAAGKIKEGAGKLKDGAAEQIKRVQNLVQAN